ncbi:PH domain-containing protein [Amycolatopsis thermoflava]|uniref:PH domain-containing protein n=1 Tax=Amycolatopsis thermoflava TaxID=84480 RepID=UPI003657156C
MRGETITVLRRGGEQWYIAVAALAVAILFIWVVADGTFRGDPFGNIAELILATGWGFWGAIRYLQVRVEVKEGGVVVHNFFTRYSIPWSAVSRLEAQPALRIVLSDGKVVAPQTGAESLASTIRHNRKQRAMQERIEGARRRALDQGSAEVVTKQIWAGNLAILAAVYAGMFSVAGIAWLVH